MVSTAMLILLRFTVYDFYAFFLLLSFYRLVILVSLRSTCTSSTCTNSDQSVNDSNVIH